MFKITDICRNQRMNVTPSYLWAKRATKHCLCCWRSIGTSQLISEWKTKGTYRKRMGFFKMFFSLDFFSKLVGQILNAIYNLYRFSVISDFNHFSKDVMSKVWFLSKKRKEKKKKESNSTERERETDRERERDRERETERETERQRQRACVYVRVWKLSRSSINYFNFRRSLHSFRRPRNLLCARHFNCARFIWNDSLQHFRWFTMECLWAKCARVTAGEFR